jgi:hypothetical protein
MNIEQKAAKSKLTQDELKKIVSGKRVNADTVAVAYDKAQFSEKSHYDVSHIADSAARAQAIESARGDNAAIYLALKETYDAKIAEAKKRTE